jgi:hypothetical protein
MSRGRKSEVRSGRDDKGYGGVSVQSGCRLRELQVPPLRYASVGMTKVTVVFPVQSGCRLRELQVPPLRYASVGMKKVTVVFPSRADAS